MLISVVILPRGSTCVSWECQNEVLEEVHRDVHRLLLHNIHQGQVHEIKLVRKIGKVSVSVVFLYNLNETRKS